MSRVNNKEKYKEYDHNYYIKHKRPKSKIGQAELKIADLEAKLAEMTKKYELASCPTGGLVDRVRNLEQQLAEKNIRIEELESQFAYECECNMQLVDLQKQLAEKQNTIDEINKEFVQSIHDWKAFCAEKDKEIEKLKQELEETNAGYDFTYEQSSEAIKELKQNQTQLAIQELEKVKNFVDGRTYCADYINKRIQDLKGEK